MSEAPSGTSATLRVWGGFYEPKPRVVKGKTLKREDLPGLTDREANDFVGLASAKGMSPAEIAELESMGFRVGSPKEQWVITSPNGKTRYYSDVDLHGVYGANGAQGYSNELASELNCRFVHRAIQHGPQDLWELRNDPRMGSN